MASPHSLAANEVGFASKIVYNNERLAAVACRRVCWPGRYPERATHGELVRTRPMRRVIDTILWGH